MICPLTASVGASSNSHAAENFAVFDFDLASGDMSAIHSMACGERKVRPQFEPDWDA